MATPFTSGAQSLEDRVRVLWDRSYSAPDSVLQEARQLLQEARAEGSYHAEVNALELQGEAHFYLLDLDSCRHYYQQALGVAQRKEDLEEQAHIHTSLGSIHSEFGERDASLSEFRQALTIWESLQDTVQLCGLEVRIGGALDRFDLDDLSMQHFVHALRHCADCGDSLFYAHALNGIGVLHKKQRNYLKALAVMDSARVIYARQGEAFGQGGVLNNLGVVYKSLGRYE
ncbi:MAG: tetratricopeptide repeat protein, partial [Flavobacteriales bacterium]|nr:tetratricopeptide repeat protein [Flavobacteriales bacterium]